MTTTYANSPIKSCDTCAHQQRAGSHDKVGEFAYCARFQTFCSIAVERDYRCGFGLREWRAKSPPPPRPPRRSLRQWFLDTFWTVRP